MTFHSWKMQMSYFAPDLDPILSSRHPCSHATCHTNRVSHFTNLDVKSCILTFTALENEQSVLVKCKVIVAGFVVVTLVNSLD